MYKLIIKGDKKSIIQKCTNPEILVWTDDMDCMEKAFNITGNRIVKYKYQIDIDGQILKPFGEYSLENVSENIIIPKEIIDSVKKGIVTKKLTITAQQDDKNIITKSIDITINAKTKFSKVLDGKGCIKLGNNDLLKIEKGTLEVRFKTKDVNSLSKLGGKLNAYMIPQLNNAYADDNFHTVTYVFEKAAEQNCTLYIDGLELNKYSISNINQDSDLVIGDKFVGTIEEVRLWNDELSIDEIKKNLSNQLYGDEENLIGYWRLNEFEGDTAFDSTSNNINGKYYLAANSEDTSLDDICKAEIKILNPNATISKNTDFPLEFNIKRPILPTNYIYNMNEVENKDIKEFECDISEIDNLSLI